MNTKKIKSLTIAAAVLYALAAGGLFIRLIITAVECAAFTGWRNLLPAAGSFFMICVLYALLAVGTAVKNKIVLAVAAGVNLFYLFIAFWVNVVSAFIRGGPVRFMVTSLILSSFGKFSVMLGFAALLALAVFFIRKKEKIVNYTWLLPAIFAGMVPMFFYSIQNCVNLVGTARYFSPVYTVLEVLALLVMLIAYALFGSALFLTGSLLKIGVKERCASENGAPSAAGQEPRDTEHPSGSEPQNDESARDGSGQDPA